MAEKVTSQPKPTELRLNIVASAYCARCLFPDNKKIPDLEIPSAKHPLEPCLRPLFKIIYGTSIDHCQCSLNFCPFSMITIPFCMIATPVSIMNCVFCSPVTGSILGGVAGGSLCCSLIVDRFYRNIWVAQHAKEWALINRRSEGEEAHYPVGKQLWEYCGMTW